MTREALIKSPSEFLKSPMVQDEEEFPANTEVFKGESDEVLRHWARNSDEKRFNQCFPRYGKKLWPRTFQRKGWCVMTKYDFLAFVLLLLLCILGTTD